MGALIGLGQYFIAPPRVIEVDAKTLLLTEIQWTVFSEIDTDDKNFQQLLQDHSPGKVLEVIHQFHEELEQKQLRRVQIREPLQLLKALLDGTNLFNGWPLVLGFTDGGGFPVPLIEWVDHGQGVLFNRVDLKRGPLDPPDMSFSLMKKYFKYFYDLFPMVNHRSFCHVDAMALYLGGMLKYKVEIIEASRGAAEKLEPKFPFPEKVVWTHHYALVVCDDKNQEWVLDFMLDEPVPLSQWQSAIGTSRFHNCKHSQETFDRLRRMYLFEKATNLRGRWVDWSS